MIYDYYEARKHGYKRELSERSLEKYERIAKQIELFEAENDRKGTLAKDVDIAYAQAFKSWQLKRGLADITVRFLFFTGCRFGEAVGLRWGNVIDDCATIVFCESIGRTKEVQGIKNKKDRRFPADKFPELHKLLLDMRSQTNLPDSEIADQLVFTTREGRLIDDSNFRHRCWNTVLEATGVRKRKPYATRCTFVTQALTANIPVNAVAKLAGHSIATLQKHYASWLNEDGGKFSLY